MSDLKTRLLQRFRDPEYRHGYVESFLNSLVSTQIRHLRERRGWSQKELAEAIGTVQSGISRIESPDYSAWRIETLRKVAKAFDMALSVKFVSFGDELNDIMRFGDGSLMRPSFEDDPAFESGEDSSDTGAEVIRIESHAQFSARTSINAADSAAELVSIPWRG